MRYDMIVSIWGWNYSGMKPMDGIVIGSIGIEWDYKDFIMMSCWDGLVNVGNEIRDWDGRVGNWLATGCEQDKPVVKQYLSEIDVQRC